MPELIFLNKLWVDQGKEFYSKLMQEWLDTNDIVMYSTHNEGKSVIAERFLKTLNVKIKKKMTANYSKSYLPYLNKLVDQYINTYHHSVNKKPINVDYSASTEKIKTNPELSKFKVNDRVNINKKITSNKTKHIEADRKLTDLTKKVIQI